jgi:hypothetical protein
MFKKIISSTSVKIALAIFVVAAVCFLSCKKSSKSEQTYNTPNSLTLYKGIDSDLTTVDTVQSISNTTGKFIPVSGTAGATNGLKSIEIGLYLADNDSLISQNVITHFFRPDYAVLNSVPASIPNNLKGRMYKIMVTVTDNAGQVTETKSFMGMDLVTCDPLPPCIAANQITVMVQTPSDTPPDETISIFGGFNNWTRGDVTYNLYKNPDVPNCYCITLAYPPGVAPWQLGELYVTRGTYETDGVASDGSVFVVNYATTDLGAIWKVVVPRWRDK